ncbi:ena/VASP-like protein isoform X2 [Argiope bruennichi]|uniref:ena/VASP-like protein isoform X2 n=1 Tax=Argiope bruennichi TaxID=94029 RepID=UPI002494370B|nr:ena/VASP-like protein isoform X2 [Argiope bruennichi]
MSEQSVASARASVLVYDSQMKKWVPSGTSSGLSKVHIYHHVENNTFRVVGRKVQDHEVVINCSILKGLKYFQNTPTFHQWRDNSQIHGLNFASRDDAETFALAMERVLDILGHSTSHRSSQSQPLYQTIGHSGVSLDDYAEYRGWMNNENGERKTNSEYGHYRSSQGNHSSHPSTPGSIPSPSTYSHHRASSASSVPPQPMSIVPQQPSPQSTVPPPPPPPPPPPSNSSISGLATLPRLHLRQNPEQEVTETSLAAAIATAKLKKTPTKPTNDTPGNETKQFPKGMANMLDEMTRTLARRRAQTDSSIDAESISSGDSNRSWNKQGFGSACSPGINSGGESPQSLHRTDTDTENKNAVVLDAVQLDKIKQEIVSEVRLVMNKVKQEIIDAVRMEMNRR